MVGRNTRYANAEDASLDKLLLHLRAGWGTHWEVIVIIVHHLENSRSQRVLWLLEELALEYEIKRYARNPKTMLAPPELKEVHPLGKSPVISDGDNVVAESGAIIEYLVEHHGNGSLAPARGTPERLRYTYYLHYAEGSAMPPLLLMLVFNRLPVMAPTLIRPLVRGVANTVKGHFIEPQIALHLGYLESELELRDWFAGDAFSAADIQMSFPLEAAAARGGLNERYPRLSAFLERAHARPAYQRALEKGGPYQLMS